MRPSTRTVVFSIVGLVVLIQLVPISRTNPPQRSAPPAPPAPVAVFERACYGCHSNETRWPWYAYVAPVSWLVGHDVNDGRRHLNFSEWDSYTPAARQKKLEDIAEEIEQGDMPPWYYTPVHPEAKLSASEVNAILSWARAARSSTTR